MTQRDRAAGPDSGDESQPAGRYSVPFDAAGLSSGVYFYRMVAGDVTVQKKIILLK